MTTLKNNWTLEEVEQLFHLPLLDLVHKAASVHREFHDANKLKVSTLISLKTGTCIEDCSYCAQSSRYKTHVEAHKFLNLQQVLDSAKKAKENGASRVCLSASWRKVEQNKDFESLLEMIREVKKLDLKVCCTLGMITKEQAQILAKEGISAYNHNLDTSAEFYPHIITTRTYQDRLDTLKNLMEAEVPYCSGGILGLGESELDRVKLLHTLATLPKHPYSVPFNCIVPVEGTPMANKPLTSVFEMVRMIATARILMPEAIVCLAAGRTQLTDEGQALCYLAGASSIFIGEKLLTTPNPELNKDKELMKVLGMEHC